MTQTQKPLFPRATAIWLIDNTGLTFKQIADFCCLHELEVQGIADGEIADGMLASNPIDNKQLTQAEIDRCTKDPKARLQILENKDYEEITKKTKKKARYIPIAQRQDKPDAILWITKNYPDIPESKIVKLIGTTKTTIKSIKDQTYWNLPNLRQRDPVMLGLCSQSALNELIDKYAPSAENEAGEA